MKVYFTAATSFNGELHETYDFIGKLITVNKGELISGNQIINKSILAEDKKLTAGEIYERERKLIQEADMLIVEGSRPSLGVGSEITHALNLGKPVLVLVSTKFEDRISPMIQGDPSESLFLRFYNEDNLQYKIADFISYVSTLKKRRGKLIVIDGGDGSGKTTQANMLVGYFKKKEIPVKYVDFPQYYHSFHGKTAGKLLRGEFGKIDEVSPYFASLTYALDRATMRREMEDFLAKGGVIVANRYATSSMAHQAAKFTNEKDQKEFLKWIYELEYKIHRIPKENMVIYLHVPYQSAQGLLEKRSLQTGKEQDMAEKNTEHQRRSEEMYLSLAKKYKHWKTIECMNDDKLLSREEIFEMVLNLVNPML